MKKFFSKSERPAQQIGCRAYETAVRKLAFRKRSLISKWPAFDSSTVRTTMVMVVAALCTLSHTLGNLPRSWRKNSTTCEETVSSKAARKTRSKGSFECKP